VTISGGMHVHADLTYRRGDTLCDATSGTFDETYSYASKTTRLRLIPFGTGAFSFFDRRGRSSPDLKTSGTVTRTIAGGLACDNPGAKCGPRKFSDMTAEIDLIRQGSRLMFNVGNGAENSEGYGEECPGVRTWTFPSIPDRPSIGSTKGFWGATVSISRLLNPRVPRIVLKFRKTYPSKGSAPTMSATTTTSYTITLVRRKG
jgi:hypothetical protein